MTISNVVPQTAVSATEAAVCGSPKNQNQETNKLSVTVPGVAGHPDEQAPDKEPANRGEGIRDFFSFIELAHEHRSQVVNTIGGVNTSLDMIENLFGVMMGELMKTFVTRHELLAEIFVVDKKSFADAVIDTESVKNAFNLSDAEMQELSENTDELYPFPKPINCSKGSGKQFLSFHKLQLWHRRRIETALTKARGDFLKAKETFIDVMDEMYFSCIGRREILWKLLDDIDLTDERHCL